MTDPTSAPLPPAAPATPSPNGEAGRAALLGQSMVAIIAFSLASVLLRAVVYPRGSVMATLPVGMGLLVLLPLVAALGLPWRGRQRLAELRRPLLALAGVAALLLLVVASLGGLRPWRQLVPLAAVLALTWHVLGHGVDPGAPAGRPWGGWPLHWGPPPRRPQWVLGLAVPVFLLALTVLTLRATGPGTSAGLPEAHLMYRGAGMFLLLLMGWAHQWSLHARDPAGDHRLALTSGLGGFVLGMMALHNLLYPWLQAHSTVQPVAPLSLMFFPLGAAVLLALRRWPGETTLRLALMVLLFTIVTSIWRNGAVALAFLSLLAYALAVMLPARAWRTMLGLWLAVLATTGAVLPAEALQPWFLQALQATGVLALTLHWARSLPATAQAAAWPAPSPPAAAVPQRLALPPLAAEQAEAGATPSGRQDSTSRHVGVATGTLVLLLAGLAGWQWRDDRLQAAHQVQQATVEASLQSLSTYLLLVEQLPHAMSPLLAWADPTPEVFAGWSAELLRPMGPGLSLQWAPQGRLALGAPRALAPAVRGLDLREHPGNGTTVRQLLQTGQGGWSPVFPKVEGGQAIAYFLPVASGSPSGPADGTAPTTRGLALAILHLPEGLAELPPLRDATLPLRLWLAPPGQPFRLAWQNEAATALDPPLLPTGDEAPPAGWLREQGEVEVLARLPAARPDAAALVRRAPGLQLRVEVGPPRGGAPAGLTTLAQVALLAALLCGWLSSEFTRHRLASARAGRLAAELGTTARLLDESVTGMLLFDGEGRLVLANEAGLQQMGRAHGTLSDLPLLAAPDLQALARQTLADGLPREQAVDLPGPAGSPGVRSLVLHLGRTRLAGQPHLLLQAVDISRQRQEQQAAEQARREAEANRERLAHAAEAAQLGVWIRELPSERLIWDARMFELYGLPAPSATPAVLEVPLWRPLVHPEDLPVVEASRLALVEGRGVYDPVFRIVLPDGRLRWLEGSAYLERDPQGRPTRVIGFSRDVTAARMAREALETALAAAQAASQAKSRFLATMSHELRTPLNAMLGTAQLLMRPDVSEAQRVRWAGTVLEAGHGLLAQVNQVLDYSKLEAGQPGLATEPFRPGWLLADVAALFRPLAQQKGLALSWHWAGPGDEPACQGDAGKLRQMLANLVSNALKFTTRGQVTLSARATGTLGGDGCLEFSVRDTGPGIAAQSQARLFLPFSQVDDPMTRPHGGTGLGLAIVRGLARAMQGEAGVESRPGQGARFWFTARCAPADQPLPAQRPALAAPALPPLRGEVLVAQDEGPARELLLASLTALGLSPRAVPAAALVCADGSGSGLGPAAAAPAVVLWALSGTVGQLPPALQAPGAPPVLALVADALPATRHAVLQAGFAEVLSPPLPLERLHEVLARWTATPDPGAAAAASGPSADGGPSARPPDPLQAAALRLALPGVQALLAQRKYAAVEALEQLVRQGQGGPWAAPLEQARQALDRMRYEDALQPLADLAARLDREAGAADAVSPPP
ncbi:ATP-binding protein [Ideonella livida]|uniref:Virulence sensor protein BvgS n=1 Tax=Ideonella livida TaxID=2707176 RepID=A0A7C9PFJ3_9BURK|nr:ATP-binding protein [Ideonella livida]NDY90428.1 PAS domain-containing protein [Ideonella livida]